MRNLDELDIVFQKLETLEDQKREAEIAKLRSKITKSYVINTVLAALIASNRIFYWTYNLCLIVLLT